MKRLLLLSLLAFALVGCHPQERVWWSPDGDRAAVLIHDELHLADADGALTGDLSKGDSGPGEVLTKSLDWLPHGEGFIVHRIRIIDAWQEARELMPEADRKRTEKLAETMPALLKASLALAGDGSIQGLLNRLLSSETELASNAFNLALEQDADAIRKALADAPKALANLKERPDNGLDRYALNELARVDLSSGGAERETQVLLRSVNSLSTPLISPSQDLVLFGRRVGEGQTVQLEVCRLDGSGHATVAKGALAAFDWTADRQSVVYMTAVGGQDSLLKRVRKLKVLTAAGQPIAWNPAANPPEDLTTAIIPFLPRLAVLPGDKVLFAAQPVTWPHAEANPDKSPQLFTVSLDGGDLAAVPVADGDLPMNLGYFVVSPDGQRVAVVESETDAVAVISLATGQMELVSPPHANWQCRTLPSWRNAEELTFAALDRNSGRVQWSLWNLQGERRDLSESWPAKATDDWLEYKEPRSN